MVNTRKLFSYIRIPVPSSQGYIIEGQLGSVDGPLWRTSLVTSTRGNLISTSSGRCYMLFNPKMDDDNVSMQSYLVEENNDRGLISPMSFRPSLCTLRTSSPFTGIKSRSQSGRRTNKVQSNDEIQSMHSILKPGPILPERWEHRVANPPSPQNIINNIKQTLEVLDSQIATAVMSSTKLTRPGISTRMANHADPSVHGAASDGYPTARVRLFSTQPQKRAPPLVEVSENDDTGTDIQSASMTDYSNLAQSFSNQAEYGSSAPGTYNRHQPTKRQYYDGDKSDDDGYLNESVNSTVILETDRMYTPHVRRSFYVEAKSPSDQQPASPAKRSRRNPLPRAQQTTDTRHSFHEETESLPDPQTASPAKRYRRKPSPKAQRSNDTRRSIHKDLAFPPEPQPEFTSTAHPTIRSRGTHSPGARRTNDVRRSFHEEPESPPDPQPELASHARRTRRSRGRPSLMTQKTSDARRSFHEETVFPPDPQPEVASHTRRTRRSREEPKPRIRQTDDARRSFHEETESPPDPQPEVASHARRTRRSREEPKPRIRQTDDARRSFHEETEFPPDPQPEVASHTRRTRQSKEKLSPCTRQTDDSRRSFLVQRESPQDPQPEFASPAKRSRSKPSPRAQRANETKRISSLKDYDGPLPDWQGEHLDIPVDNLSHVSRSTYVLRDASRPRPIIMPHPSRPRTKKQPQEPQSMESKASRNSSTVVNSRKVKKGNVGKPWTAEEDARLIDAMLSLDTHEFDCDRKLWRSASRLVGTRHWTSCQDRFLNHHKVPTTGTERLIELSKSVPVDPLSSSLTTQSRTVSSAARSSSSSRKSRSKVARSASSARKTLPDKEKIDIKKSLSPRRKRSAEDNSHQAKSPKDIRPAKKLPQKKEQDNRGSNMDTLSETPSSTARRVAQRAKHNMHKFNTEDLDSKPTKLAGKNTLKRKEQINELVWKSNVGYSPDVFENSHSENLTRRSRGTMLPSMSVTPLPDNVVRKPRNVISSDSEPESPAALMDSKQRMKHERYLKSLSSNRAWNIETFVQHDEAEAVATHGKKRAVKQADKISSKLRDLERVSRSGSGNEEYYYGHSEEDENIF